MLFAEADDELPLFEGVVDDGAIGGAVNHLPHPALDGSGAANQVREVLAGVGAGVIYGAVVSVEEDAAGNMKPSKKKSGEKIDGIVAAIMALDRAIRAGGNARSVYEDRGIREL